MATQDELLVRALQNGWRDAPITGRERAMLTFVEKLTLTPGAVTKDDHAPLRAVGFDDRAIFQIAAIASFFNYVNRMADALGLGRG